MELANFFQKMEALCDERGLLKWYRSDLKIDQDVIERIPNGEYLWIVTETSSDCYPISVHQRTLEWVQAVLNARKGTRNILISQIVPAKGIIREISAQKALDLASQAPKFQFKGDRLMSESGEAVGAIQVDAKRCMMSNSYDINVSYRSDLESIGEGYWKTLILYEMEKRYGLWFKLEIKQAEKEVA